MEQPRPQANQAKPIFEQKWVWKGQKLSTSMSTNTRVATTVDDQNMYTKGPGISHQLAKVPSKGQSTSTQVWMKKTTKKEPPISTSKWVLTRKTSPPNRQAKHTPYTHRQYQYSKEEFQSRSQAHQGQWVPKMKVFRIHGNMAWVPKNVLKPKFTSISLSPQPSTQVWSKKTSYESDYTQVFSQHSMTQVKQSLETQAAKAKAIQGETRQ